MKTEYLTTKTMFKFFASRTANGSTDTETLKVKIANGPVITGVELSF